MKNAMVLLVATLFTMAAAAGGEFITLESGQVIAVPEKGATCQYDYDYCFFGWTPEGNFPGVQFGEIIHTALDTCKDEARDFPLCPSDELSLGGSNGRSPYPCYELITSEDD